MKRLLSLSAFLMMALLSFAHDFEVKNADGKTIYYNITTSSDLTVAVTYRGTTDYEYRNEYTGDVTIPATVTYNGKTYSVTSIGLGAFDECYGLTSITIPNSVTSIGLGAFYKCSGLTSISIPNSVTAIGDNAFSNCTGLTSITIPNSVTTLGSSIFGGCSSLTSITVASGNTNYDSRENCNAIIETASNTLIEGCKNTIIPNSVTSIGRLAFRACTSLTSITIPHSVTNIGWGAFQGCSGLNTVTIPNSVKKIDEYSFQGCSGLKSIEIPNSVTFIGSYAFKACTSLTSVTIPNSVTGSGQFVFDDCSSLTSITFHCQNISSEFRVPNIKEVIIGDEVTTIDEYSFCGCCDLTSIEIPNSVKNIRKCAFSGSGLTSVTIPNSVMTIHDYAFSGCTGLTSVTIGNGMKSIEFGVFEGCSSLASVTIPNSVTSIDESAFSGCSGLTSITIPNSVTSIGVISFSFCSSLTSITIPNSVTSIGGAAFYGCSGLTTITIPNSVTSIGSYAFDNTAWYNNQPDGMVYAGKLAYEYKGTMPENTSITLKEGTLGISCSAFEDCSSLTSITIPNSVTTIGKDAFRNCSGLTFVTIPNSVTNIGDYVFSSCRGLKSVSIGNSVTSIGSSAFAYCRSLKEITSYIQNPFATGSYCWDLVDKFIPLYVPAGTKREYKKTGGWKDFTNIIEFGAEAIEPTEEAKEVVMSVLPNQMDLNGMVVDNTYYALDAENGDGADSENGCVVINSITTDEAVSSIVGKEISDESVKDAFKGVIFMVPVGTGKVSVTGQTLGSSSLMVKVGSQAAQAFQLAERETVQIPYTVTEPTYVYIYAGNTGATAARRTTATSAAENSVKLYSYKYDFTETTGIESLTPVPFTKGEGSSNIYSIDGRKVSNSGLSKGIYIKNGKKIVVK